MAPSPLTLSPTTARRLFGVKLRAARDRRGLKQTQVAKKADCTQATITRYEGSLEPINLKVFERIAAVLRLGSAETHELAGLAVHSAGKSAWSGERRAVAEWLRIVYDTECDARRILNWYSERLPGPLQSEHFMLALYDLEGATDVTPQIAMRQQRRTLFDSTTLREYRCVIGQGFFERMPHQLGRAAAHDQVCHLLELGRRPNIFIQVLPFTARIRYLEPDFMVLNFAEPEIDLAFVEHLVGGENITERDEVDEFIQEWARISAAAWDVYQTRSYLTGLAGELA